MKLLPLLPHPRKLVRTAGDCRMPARCALLLPPDLVRDTVLLPVVRRLQEAMTQAGVHLELVSDQTRSRRFLIRVGQDGRAPHRPEGHAIKISVEEIQISFFDEGGLRAAVATLRQLLRQYGRRLPCLQIRDFPDFPRRGVMLDVSRGRVPRLETLLDLAGHLADFKINELQLYTEHTFAYPGYETVWRSWGALTGAEIRTLDARCRELGIELVPNQNSFGHLREWLSHPPLRKVGLAEVTESYEGPNGEFLRRPSTLAPWHPCTLPFLRDLYDELLPYFTSKRFNVGCDEPWDLGLGQSRERCELLGKGRVYLEFLLRIHHELGFLGRQMMFWGDIVLHHPELIRELPKDLIALNWGYEANHPFEEEAAQFAQAGVPFYVCPGTSTWMTMVGRHDNAFANLRRAADAGRKHGALGYLITDWGDGGHPQPLAVSWPLYVLGAALSWCGKTCDGRALAAVLSRDVYDDPTGRVARAALHLGLAHKQLDYREPNCTPLGAVIAAPPPELREIFCRNGLKYHAHIAPQNIQAARDDIEAQRASLRHASPATATGKILSMELDLAARLAVQSCDFMLWQQASAAGRASQVRPRAQRGIAALTELAEEINSYWPMRNKGTAFRHWPFLKWRVADYRRGRGQRNKRGRARRSACAVGHAGTTLTARAERRALPPRVSLPLRG